MNNKCQLIICFMVFILSNSCIQSKQSGLETRSLYPWCIVAYDSLERTPNERIDMLKELGFKKYAYDWRDHHLGDTKDELSIAMENEIDVIAVWMWLNAKRDTIGQLCLANERIFSIIKELKLKTTFWVSMSSNFFIEQTAEESLSETIDYIRFIADSASKINCKVALYNHTGWFANPYNQMKVIQALPNRDLSIVYNFHHGHTHVDSFSHLVKDMLPYLSAVNLNGMMNGQKILTIGNGNYEKRMLQTLLEAGFKGPWGILGHVEGTDVKTVLQQNMAGLKRLQND